MDKPIPEAVRALAQELIDSVAGMGHGGRCRCWQYGADDDRCECGVTTAKEEAKALEAAITAAQQQGQAVDFVDIANRAQAATGRGVMPSTVEAVLRAAGVVQPMQQGGGEVICPYNGKPCLCREPRGKCKACAAPPSAPVGVEVRTEFSDEIFAVECASAQQPAAVDEAMVERVAISIYAAARGFSAEVAREKWPSVEQKSRFTGPARAALEGDAS